MHEATSFTSVPSVLEQNGTTEQALRDAAQYFPSVTSQVAVPHVQDATPLTLSQKFSAYVQEIIFAQDRIRDSMKRVCMLAQGSTAVSTGLNAPKGFGEDVAAKLKEITGLPFVSAPNQVRGHG